VEGLKLSTKPSTVDNINFIIIFKLLDDISTKLLILFDILLDGGRCGRCGGFKI
jgi:hypothetical protein